MPFASFRFDRPDPFHLPGCEKHDQSLGCARGVEIGPDLAMIAAHRFRLRRDIALPIDHEANAPVSVERDRISNSDHDVFGPPVAAARRNPALGDERVTDRGDLGHRQPAQD